MVKFANFDGSQGTVVVSGYLGVAGERHRSVSFWIRTLQDELATICYWGHDLTTFPGKNRKEQLNIRDPRVIASGFPDGSESRVRLAGGYIELFGKGSRRESSVKVNDGNFHHVVCSWTALDAAPGHEDFQVADIWVDTVLSNGKGVGPGKRFIFGDGTERITTAIRTPEQIEVLIGARPATRVSGIEFTEFFEGDLDEFALYNDVLSSGNVQSLYASGTPGVDILSLEQVPALQFWYRMGDDPADVVPSGTLPFGTFFDQNPFTLRHGVVSSGVTIS